MTRHASPATPLEPIGDPSFWSGYAPRQAAAEDFTSFYGRRAWDHAAVSAGARVLDIACGTGALAVTAAASGARVLATDFAPGMVEAVLARGGGTLEARVMDGQALDLPDGSFDAAFSIFGIMLFPDWRAGLTEMARVVRPGGTGCLATWREPAGAAASLLLARLSAVLFPERTPKPALAGMEELRDPARLDAAFRAVGFDEVSIIEASTDFIVDAALLDDAEQLFRFSSLWGGFGSAERNAVLTSLRAALAARGGSLPVASPALIAAGRKRADGDVPATAATITTG